MRHWAALILVMVVVSSAAAQQNPPQTPLVSGVFLEDAHTVAGWVTVATGLAAVVFNPEVAGDRTHHALGLASAGMAAVTMGLGLFAYGDKLNVDMGWGPDQIHALMGAVGGTLMLTAVAVAPRTAHEVIGGAGLALMSTAVVWKLVY